MTKAKSRQQVGCSLPSRHLRDIAHQQGEHHILQSAEIRQQMVELINKAELFSPNAGSPLIIQCRHFLGIDLDRSLKATFQQANRL